MTTPNKDSGWEAIRSWITPVVGVICTVCGGMILSTLTTIRTDLVTIRDNQIRQEERANSTSKELDRQAKELEAIKNHIYKWQ
jgi:hypothetical protein